MTKYSAAELRELRLIDKLVREALRRLDLSGSSKSIDELIASGEIKAAECHVMSKNMVDPDWLERVTRNSRERS